VTSEQAERRNDFSVIELAKVRRVLVAVSCRDGSWNGNRTRERAEMRGERNMYGERKGGIGAMLFLSLL